MKKHKINRWLGSLILGVVTMLAVGSPQAVAEPFNGVSFQVFYDELSPYGDWVKDARYGYVWIPAVGRDFHPYGTEGHWVMTEYGNTWVSYYDWGWAPFHYGRWMYEDYYGWAWVPGYDWGPAWVNWRTGGGYYGWAPLAPGLSINVQVNLPSSYWVFVPQNRITYRYIHRYYAPRRTRVKIYNNTTIINNTVVYNNNTYVGGPQRRDIERVTRTTVPVYNVQTGARPGRAVVSNNSVAIYRPSLNSTASQGRSVEARPSRVMEPSEARGVRSQAVTRSATPANRGNGTVTATPGSQRTQENRVAVPGRTETRSAAPASQNQSATPARQNQTARPAQSRTSAPTQTQGSQVQRGSSTQQAPAANQPARATQARPATNSRATQGTTVRSGGSDRTNAAPRVSQPAQSKAPAVKATPAATRKAAPAGSSGRSTTSSRGGRGN